MQNTWYVFCIFCFAANAYVYNIHMTSIAWNPRLLGGGLRQLVVGWEGGIWNPGRKSEMEWAHQASGDQAGRPPNALTRGVTEPRSGRVSGRQGGKGLSANHAGTLGQQGGGGQARDGGRVLRREAVCRVGVTGGRAGRGQGEGPGARQPRGVGSHTVRVRLTGTAQTAVTDPGGLMGQAGVAVPPGQHLVSFEWARQAEHTPWDRPRCKISPLLWQQPGQRSTLKMRVRIVFSDQNST